jgi:hypothetical protein
MVLSKQALARENRELQRAYRERHGEDLRKARRVATALMALRTDTVFDRAKKWRMIKILERLEDFLDQDERRLFISFVKLTPAQRQAKAESGAKGYRGKNKKGG